VSVTRPELRADRRVGLLLAGVVLLSFVSIATTIALPASDRSIQAKARDLTAQEKHGMKVFKAEGCWYCHTSYVRETKADAALGKPLDAKAYAGMSPSMLGTERDGPDLTYLHTRFTDASELVAYLEDPSKGARRTSMPSYGFLSDDDLEALAAYLLSRR
jgi:cbb3-type cytochrome oxidase cytochrome c subunit